MSSHGRHDHQDQDDLELGGKQNEKIEVAESRIESNKYDTEAWTVRIVFRMYIHHHYHHCYDCYYFCCRFCCLKCKK